MLLVSCLPSRPTVWQPGKTSIFYFINSDKMLKDTFKSKMPAWVWIILAVYSANTALCTHSVFSFWALTICAILYFMLYLLW